MKILADMSGSRPFPEAPSYSFAYVDFSGPPILALDHRGPALAVRCWRIEFMGRGFMLITGVTIR